MMRRLHKIQISEFINKVLLEYSHTHLLMYCLCQLSSSKEELSSCCKDFMVWKAENIYHLGLFGKSLLIPGLDTEQVPLSTYNMPGAKVTDREGNQQGCVYVLNCFRCVQLFATLWTVAHQAPLFMQLSREEYWSGLPFPPPGDLPHPGIEPALLMSPSLASGLFTTSTTWNA